MLVSLFNGQVLKGIHTVCTYTAAAAAAAAAASEFICFRSKGRLSVERAELSCAVL